MREIKTVFMKEGYFVTTGQLRQEYFAKAPPLYNYKMYNIKILSVK